VHQVARISSGQRFYWLIVGSLRGRCYISVESRERWGALLEVRVESCYLLGSRSDDGSVRLFREQVTEDLTLERLQSPEF